MDAIIKICKLNYVKEVLELKMRTAIVSKQVYRIVTIRVLLKQSRMLIICPMVYVITMTVCGVVF